MKTLLRVIIGVAIVAVIAVGALVAVFGTNFGLFDEDNSAGVAAVQEKAGGSLGATAQSVTVEKLVDWPSCFTAKAYVAGKPDASKAYKAKRIDGVWDIQETSEVQDQDDNYTQTVCLESNG